MKTQIEKPKTPGGGGARALAKARRKNYYSQLPSITLRNLQRSRARHLRNFPNDAQAREAYAKLYGKGALDSPTCKPRARMLAKSARKTKARKRLAAITTEPVLT